MRLKVSFICRHQIVYSRTNQKIHNHEMNQKFSNRERNKHKIEIIDLKSINKYQNWLINIESIKYLMF